MSLRALACAALIAVLGLAACRPPQESSKQAIATDLHAYMGELGKWEPKEQAIFQAVDDVDKSEYADDDYVIRTFKTALPTIDDLLRRASEFKPLTPEVLDIHDHYKAGYEKMKGAIEAVIAAASSKNYIALAQAKQELKQSQKDVLKAFRAVDIMSQEHAAELEQMNKS